jgi:hypothetical protein
LIGFSDGCREAFRDLPVAVPKLWLGLKLFRATYVIVVDKSISGMEKVVPGRRNGDYTVNVWYCRIYTSQWKFRLEFGPPDQ